MAKPYLYKLNASLREFRDGRWFSLHPLCVHGTRAGYSRYGCRCEPCSDAERAYRAGRRTQPVPEHFHGTTTGYQRGCRDECCKAAHSAQKAEYWTRRGRVVRNDGREHGTRKSFIAGCRCRRCVGRVPHGTEDGYGNYGCRCAACREANAERVARQRGRRIAAPVPDHVHGTENGYSNYGCRCDPCREIANRKGLVRQRRRRAERKTP